MEKMLKNCIKTVIDLMKKWEKYRLITNSSRMMAMKSGKLIGNEFII